MSRSSTSSAWRRLVDLLLIGTALLLVAGLCLPAVRMEQGVDSEAHSILVGIVDLLGSGDVLLGLLILAFSVVFPVAKLLGLWLLWRGRIEDEEAQAEWLAKLGKWSMLDVFVIAILVSAVRLGILAEVQSEVGAFVFAAAILGSVTCTVLIGRLLGRRQEVDARRLEQLGGWPGRALGLASVLLLVAGFFLPLMSLEKWLFWSNDYSMFSATPVLVEEGEYGVLALLLVFVVLLPAAHAAGLLLLRWIPDVSKTLARRVLALGEWAMSDVFALALLVVLARLSGMSDVTPRIGLWCILLAALCTQVHAAWIRRELSR